MGSTALLAKVHIGKKALGLDDATYRALLKQLTGKDSSARMKDWELEKVVKHMANSGVVFTKAKPDPAKLRPKAKATQAAKVRALWGEMAALGAIREGGEHTLGAWLQGRFRVDRPEWLSPRQAIVAIESLKQWKTRVELLG
jgi:phage gp16-like protein